MTTTIYTTTEWKKLSTEKKLSFIRVNRVRRKVRDGYAYDWHASY